MVNFLLMQGDDGKINYGAVGLIWFTIIFTMATMCFVLRDSIQEITGTKKDAKVGEKKKKTK
tara:strand:- start:92 stop:277 length:186 start_codon:yes stop_codon:yes gene_type:complete